MKKEYISYLIILITVIVIRTFIVTPVVVDGESMINTLQDGQILLLKKYDKTYERGDIVVFQYGKSKLVKRIIGLPGETVSYQDGVLYINHQETEDSFALLTKDFDLSSLGVETIPEGYYFVLGDNRNNSTDSRIIGLVSKQDIIGSTDFSLWPFQKIKK